jgi:hypothetical protein
VDPRTSNGLMFEQLETQKIRGKSSFETQTKTRKLNKESHGRLLSLLGRKRSCSVSSPVTGSVSISQIQSVFLSILFISLGYFYIIFNNTQKMNSLLERIVFEVRGSTVFIFIIQNMSKFIRCLRGLYQFLNDD